MRIPPVSLIHPTTFLTILLSLQSTSLLSQVSTGTATPHQSAQLDIASENKGLLIPRIERTNLVSAPAEGLLIYQTEDAKGFYYHDGDSWLKLSTSAPSIIPYSSGSPVTLTTSPESTTYTCIGFGSYDSFTDAPGNAINLIFSDVTTDYTVTIPRNGNIPNVAAFFTTATQTTVPGAATMTLAIHIYIADPNSNEFTSRGSIILSPSLTGVLPEGSNFWGSEALNIPVIAGQRVMIALISSTTGTTDPITITGVISAAINIE